MIDRIKERLVGWAVIVHAYRWLRWLNVRIFHAKEIERQSAFYSAFLRHGDLVFDVGANRGQSAEVFLYTGARVVAFEPQLCLHEHIRQRCSHLGELTIDGSALGERRGEASLQLRKYDQASSLRTEWQGEIIGQISVGVSTLSAKIAEYGVPRYCKIDVEGWEAMVLKGLTSPIEIVSIEYHLNDAEIERNTLPAIRRLTQLDGFECNVREAGSNVFALPIPIPAERFIEMFPRQLGIPLVAGYGEIFVMRSRVVR